MKGFLALLGNSYLEEHMASQITDQPFLPPADAVENTGGGESASIARETQEPGRLPAVLGTRDLTVPIGRNRVCIADVEMASAQDMLTPAGSEPTKEKVAVQ